MALSEEQAREIAKLFAKHFIARPDVMARQRRFGQYAPVHEKFTMDHLVNHILGKDSLGHYMIRPETDEVKLFALDMDLKKADPDKDIWFILPEQKIDGVYTTWSAADPRKVWMSRQQGPAREFMKEQMRLMANKLARTIHELLGIKPLVSYSGSKGIHVYGLTGMISAEMAREGALLVLQECGWQLERGTNVFGFKDTGNIPFSDIGYDYRQWDIEVYPKQLSVAEKEKGLGNLMRLPLGVNYKSPRDGAFFLDLREPFVDFKPMNPIEALTTTDIWAYAHERN